MLAVMTKKQRVLSALLSGRKYTRFTAEKQLHDHCLNSTISELQRDEGIVISRVSITVPGFGGKPTRCCEYWIEEDEIERYIKELKATFNKKQPQEAYK